MVRMLGTMAWNFCSLTESAARAAGAGSSSALPQQAHENWEPMYTTAAPWWTWVLGILLFVGLVWLVVRAFQHRGVYRVEHALPAEKLKAVHDAIHEAEQHTVGEIVPVVLGRSDRYPAADLWCGIFFALTAYFGMWILPVTVTPFGFLVAMLVAGAAGWGLAQWLPELKRPFVTRWRATAMAEEQAFQEFYRLGLHRTDAQTGVMLFVSLFERRVVVMGDVGIDAKVESDTWKELDSGILDAAKREDLGSGLESAVGRMGEILHRHFPWAEGDRNELPDRVIVRKE